MAYQVEIHGPADGSPQGLPDSKPPSSHADGHGLPLQWSLWAPRPLLLVTRGLKVVDQNPAAEALLEPGGDIQIVAGHLAFVEKFRTLAFQAFVSGLADRPGGWAYRRTCGAFIMVRADPLPGSSGDADGDLIALTIYPSDPEERYVWADFAPHFDLTRSEAVVVKRLVAGQPASIVAEELGLSIETVRTHIRRIYNKLEISSREQLFAIVGQFRLG